MDYHKLLQNKEIVTERMNDLFQKDDFEISKKYLKDIHKYLFNGILPENGKYRYYNIKRHETILNEDSVDYEDYNTIDTYLDLEMEDIKKCHFETLSEEEKINHIIDIASNIWIIHPFSDGNTRTITVFIQNYLKSLGYQIDPTYFRSNSNYFRNAIIRAVYSNNHYNVNPNREPLFVFFSNVMHQENIRLKGNELIVKEMFETAASKRKIKIRMPKK